MTVVLVVLIAGCSGRLDTARPDPIGSLRGKFDAADRNGDEMLDRDEVAVGMPSLRDVFESIDTDGNGLISAAELGSYLQWQRVLRQPPGEAMELSPR